MNAMRGPTLKAMTCIKSIVNRISFIDLFRNFSSNVFMRRLLTLYPMHLGIGNSPFWVVKMAWQMRRTTSKLWTKPRQFFPSETFVFRSNSLWFFFSSSLLKRKKFSNDKKPKNLANKEEKKIHFARYRFRTCDSVSIPSKNKLIYLHPNTRTHANCTPTNTYKLAYKRIHARIRPFTMAHSIEGENVWNAHLLRFCR